MLKKIIDNSPVNKSLQLNFRKRRTATCETFRISTKFIEFRVLTKNYGKSIR